MGILMFKALDISGKVVHYEDQVSYNSKVHIVIAILSDTEVQLEPVDEGLPIIVPAKEVSVLYSLVESISNLRTIEDLNKMIEDSKKFIVNKKSGRKTTKKVDATTTVTKEADQTLDI